MNRLFIVGMAAFVLSFSSITVADGPSYLQPHGLLVVEIDENDKLFSNSVTGEFDSSMVSFNALGQTILGHNKGGFTTEGGVTIFPGGIAERDGDNPDDPATASSKKLRADDPGLFAEGGVFPSPDYVVSMNFHHALRFFDGNGWTEPVNAEELRIFDLSEGDETGGPAADLEIIMTGDTAGLLGTINIDRTLPAIAPINVSGIHGHLGYELSRPDEGIPAVGAYMIELTISAAEDPLAGGPALQDSDPIFVVFNNQLSSSEFSEAVSAANALPDPSTAALVVAALGLLGVTARGGTRAGSSLMPRRG